MLILDRLAAKVHTLVGPPQERRHRPAAIALTEDPLLWELERKVEAAASASERALLALEAFTGMLAVAATAMVVASVVLPRQAHARDLGAIGPVHEIAEQDMLEWIHARLGHMQASGELARREAAARERALASIREPAAVPGLRSAQVRREFSFDPSVRFDEQVLDERGRVVVPAGMVANPLDVVSLRSSWFFFDGRDERQVAAARAELAAAARSGRLVKPILVAGSPPAVSQQLKARVFFDQGGLMVQRLGIAAVPARVTQAGRYLHVQEFPAP